MVQKQVLDAIVKACVRYDVDKGYMLTMAYIESGFDPKARNIGSGAAGLYQFIPSTARAYGLSNPYDPEQAANAAARLTIDNSKYLSRHGVPLEPVFLYLAHQQGMGGCVAIYKAAYRGKSISRTIRRNMDCNYGRGKSPLEFIETWKDKYERKAKEAATILSS